MATNPWRCLVALAVAALAACLTGCANLYRAPLKPAPGGLVTVQTIPLTLDFGPVVGASGLHKTASETFYLFWPYPIMDFSWGEKEKALGLLGGRTPNYAELEVFTLFGLFGRYTVNFYD